MAIGSVAGTIGGSVPCSVYAASKAGLATLAKPIAEEYGEHGIVANVVSPA